ncbi:cyclin-dependent protein kinase inhibitor SMR6 [Fagus crenata]
MGYSKKPLVEGGLVGLVRALRPINTKPKGKDSQEDVVDDDNNEGSCCTTPTEKEARIPKSLTCPPAPRVRRTKPRCHFNDPKVFFKSPELEAFLKGQGV